MKLKSQILTSSNSFKYNVKKHLKDIENINKIAKLNSFSRFVSNKDQLNDNAGDIIEQTKLKLENLRSYVKNISTICQKY